MEDDLIKEVGWKELNTSLYCGQDNMTLKVEGLGVSDLLLDLGNNYQFE